jgi:hypothetical protein
MRTIEQKGTGQLYSYCMEWAGPLQAAKNCANRVLVEELLSPLYRYGEPMLSYLDELGSGWVACWYDDKWLPPMFTPGRESLTEYGQWVLGKLKP